MLYIVFILPAPSLDNEGQSANETKKVPQLQAEYFVDILSEKQVARQVTLILQQKCLRLILGNWCYSVYFKNSAFEHNFCFGKNLPVRKVSNGVEFRFLSKSYLCLRYDSCDVHFDWFHWQLTEE